MDEKCQQSFIFSQYLPGNWCQFNESQGQQRQNRAVFSVGKYLLGRPFMVGILTFHCIENAVHRKFVNAKRITFDVCLSATKKKSQKRDNGRTNVRERINFNVKDKIDCTHTLYSHQSREWDGMANDRQRYPK